MVAMRAQRQGLDAGVNGGGVCGLAVRGRGDCGVGQEASGVFPVRGVGGAGQAVVTNFGKSPGQDMVKKSMDEFLGCKAQPSNLPGSVVAITKDNALAVEGFDSAVGDGDPEDIASEVLEDLGAGAGVLAMDHPRFLPDPERSLDVGEPSAKGVAHLGAKDDR